jgi:hypothetical protein
MKFYTQQHDFYVMPRNPWRGIASICMRDRCTYAF